MREISQRMQAQLRHIRDTRQSIVISREAVESLFKRGVVDEVDGHLFLTEAGGETLEAARSGS